MFGQRLTQWATGVVIYTTKAQLFIYTIFYFLFLLHIFGLNSQVDFYRRLVLKVITFVCVLHVIVIFASPVYSFGPINTRETF